MPTSSPLPPHLAKLVRYKRPGAETPLSVWLRTRGITQYQFAKVIGCSPKAVEWWASNRSMPGLVYAFKIERATQGGVPISSWLGTELGRLMWRGSGQSAYWDAKGAAL